MTFEELARTLPNGFHDAELWRFEMDYGRRRLQFDLDLWIGDDGAGARELYRPARVTLDQVAFLVIEPPVWGAHRKALPLCHSHPRAIRLHGCISER